MRRSEFGEFVEFGFVSLSRIGAELLFEVFRQRNERGSITVTSNLPFNDWTEVFSSEPLSVVCLHPPHGKFVPGFAC